MNPAEDPSENLTPEQMHSALFANLVIQNSQMAMLFLGKMPHPETGEIVRDPEAAQSYIAFVEMLEAKTRGNLTRQEQTLVQQSLSSLRMAFVQEMERSGLDPGPYAHPQPTLATAPAQEPVMAPAPTPTPAPAPTPAPVAPAAPAPQPELESRKRFTKKY